MTNLDSILKNRDITLLTNVSSQSNGFFSSHVWMWELDYQESWAPKNRCFWIVVLEKILESPLDCKEIKPVNPKGNQSWIFTGRTNAEAETLILWPPDKKRRLNWERPWCWERLKARRRRGRERIRRLNGIINSMDMSSEQTLGEGQGSLACCSLWGHKQSDTTE